MSGLQISYHFGNDVLRAHLARLATFDSAGANKAARAVGAYMLGEIQDHFDGQTLWDDSSMPKSMAAAMRGGQTLIDSHALYDSYHQEAHGDQVILGSDLIYAAIHDAGGNAGRGLKSHIDPRPVLGVNPRNERDIIDEVVNVLKAYE